jgi:hypothetical protein
MGGDKEIRGTKSVHTERVAVTSLSFELCSSLVEWKGQEYREKKVRHNPISDAPSSRSQPFPRAQLYFPTVFKSIWCAAQTLVHFAFDMYDSAAPSAPCHRSSCRKKPGKKSRHSTSLLLTGSQIFFPCELWRPESNVERLQLFILSYLFPIWLIGRYWRIHRRLGGRRWRGFYTSQWSIFFFSFYSGKLFSRSDVYIFYA